MKTIEMEVALMQYLNVRQNIIVPNVYWGIRGLNYECDLVRLSKNNYATEIEIKVSKSDLLKDKKKLHAHNCGFFKHLYFAVPIELKNIALSEIKDDCGLFTVEKNKQYHLAYIVKEERKPAKKNDYRWTDEQREKLLELGTMRILGMKQRLLKSVLQSVN